jgi:membrane associated rhomboid family serine protease
VIGLNEINVQFGSLVYNAKLNLKFILGAMTGLWLFNFVNWLAGAPFNVLGNIPRSRKGLLGIIFSWGPHANFNHLFFNSIPLFVLSLLIISYGKKHFIDVSLLIILLEGLAVWLFARRGNHIGASGLVAGYFGFMLIFAYQVANIVSIFLALVVLYYFGGIILSFFPTEAKSSWESHLFGFLSGISAFFITNKGLFSVYNYHIFKYFQV